MNSKIIAAAIVALMAVVVLLVMYRRESVDASANGGQKTMNTDRTEKATFAGGCFWCMEGPFEKIDGVISAVAGYTGGHLDDPSYEDVTSGESGHLEAVQVEFDPGKVSYETLVEVYWRQIDPTDEGGQFADRGSQYVTAIFYHDEAQKKMAEASKARLEKSGLFKRPVATAILPAEKFNPAEDYHQDYYKKNPARYNAYKAASGRAGFIDKAWKGCPLPRTGIQPPESNRIPAMPGDDELREKLSPLQYEVTKRNATEPPFDNQYWNNKREGIYVDVATGEPLFSSKDKFDSGTGWPSFTRPIDKSKIAEKKDSTRGMERVEIRSLSSDSHLGHVFADGPAPEGTRYCVNSAALRFVPVEDLVKEGYSEYKRLFERDGAKP